MAAVSHPSAAGQVESAPDENRREAREPARPLRVLVGVQDAGMNGIETYVEQVAAAARQAGHEVTLVATTEEVAAQVRARLSGTGIAVVALGLAPTGERRIFAERLLPQLQTRRAGVALQKAVATRLGSFDVAHLNRAALARHAIGAAERLYVTAWFYPHAPRRRVTETWKHTRGAAARRVVLAAKSLALYAGDRDGYRHATRIVACTKTLADQLREQGLPAEACPPPVRVLGAPTDAPDLAGPLRLLVCSGDLSHPRKNLSDAVLAARQIAAGGREVVLEAIGRNPDALARRAGGAARLHFEALGPLPPEKVHAAMRRAHVFVFPSLYEEWGYVAVESILSGTPVATYPVYPFADMLSGKLGVVADGKGPDALAAAILRATELPRGVTLADAGARRFGSAAVGERLTELWSR